MDVREKASSKKRLIDYYYLAEKIECPGVPLVYWDDIEAAPIVDAVEVVHGRWIEKSDLARKIYFECSHCGAQENKHTAIKGYYCWRCGAKMDGGED